MHRRKNLSLRNRRQIQVGIEPYRSNFVVLLSVFDSGLTVSHFEFTVIPDLARVEVPLDVGNRLVASTGNAILVTRYAERSDPGIAGRGDFRAEKLAFTGFFLLGVLLGVNGVH